MKLILNKHSKNILTKIIFLVILTCLLVNSTHQKRTNNRKRNVLEDTSKDNKNKQVTKIDQATKDFIINRINSIRNKLGNGIFKFKANQEQKDELNSKDKNYLFYTGEGIKASLEVFKLPPAMNLKRVYWSYDLQNKAKEWANKCKDSFDSNLSVNKNGMVSKMLEYKGDKPDKIDWKPFISYWKKSISLFEIKNIDEYHYKGKSENAFSQLIFSDLNKIGCGSKICDSDGKKQIYYVCYLSPQGPIEGSAIYRRPTKQEEVGTINCLSKGSKDKFSYLCPEDNVAKKRKINK